MSLRLALVPVMLFRIAGRCVEGGLSQIWFIGYEVSSVGLSGSRCRVERHVVVRLVPPAPVLTDEGWLASLGIM